jgi:EAL domain-containing protein (putative c-di-GMP-specific phosphodiesterase class I)
MTGRPERQLVEGIERALRKGELHMLYQPKIRLDSGVLTRLEALVRWDQPGIGPVEPSRFVPLAEKHGLIGPLTEWGLRTTLGQWRAWRDEGLDTNVAFNISAISLQSLDFPDLVERICKELEVPTDRLVLELTEGATQPLIKLMDTLTRFRIKGIGLAIDDFGTGYSSLMQLRQLPFTEVKIDKLFVKDLPRAHDSCVIVKSIVDLAHALGLVATAEGVETAEQLRYLKMLGCDVAQGYFIAEPLEPQRLAKWHSEWEKRWAGLAD